MFDAREVKTKNKNVNFKCELISHQFTVVETMTGTSLADSMVL